MLAWWLGRRGATDWAHVQQAADYVVANGPDSDQERWENQSGYSPNTIAAEIAGLICAADIARANGAAEKAASYEARRRRLAAEGRRLDRDDQRPLLAEAVLPAADQARESGRGGEYNPGDNHDIAEDQRKIVDQSFLGLVLWGAKRFDDPTVVNSLAVGDDVLGVDTPIGTVWHRFTFDGYGEQDDGGDWDLFPSPGAIRPTAGCGRCSPASAASTSCSRGSTPGRGCARSPAPRTTA